MKIYFFFWAFIFFLVDANDENDYSIQPDELKNLEKIAGYFFSNGKEAFEHFGTVKNTVANIQKFTKAEKNTIRNCTASYEFECKLYTDPNGSHEHRCLSIYQLCDGFEDCPYGDDEKYCNCKPSKKCKRANGDCIRLSEKWQCDGRLIGNACKPKTGCQETHVCCAPCSKPRGKCKRKGGTCNVKQGYYCNGKIIPEGCKGCQCCIAWSYSGKLGPKKWSTVYPNCSGIEQSPINLVPDVDNLDLTDIIFSNYKNIINASVAVFDNQVFIGNIDPNYNLTIQGGVTEEMSYLIGFKFSWGSDSSTGSEHTINGIRYPMEMQLVHRSTRYGQSDSKNAWLCILFDISDTDNPALDTIIQAAFELLVDQEGRERYAFIDTLEVGSLLPSNTQNFYRYQGSWPFPPCTEGVQYTVFTHTTTVSENQLNVLRSIKMGSKSISNNFRPLQPINERTIFLNK